MAITTYSDLFKSASATDPAAGYPRRWPFGLTAVHATASLDVSEITNGDTGLMVPLPRGGGKLLFVYYKITDMDSATTQDVDIRLVDDNTSSPRDIYAPGDLGQAAGEGLLFPALTWVDDDAMAYIDFEVVAKGDTDGTLEIVAIYSNA